MRQTPSCGQRLRDLVDADLPADELDRLARVDALLRVIAACARDEAVGRRPGARFQDGVERIPSHEQPNSDETVRPSLRLVTTPPAAEGSTHQRTEEETYELRLSFAELALVSKSLQAVKTFGALPPQDELLTDTIQLVELALKKAV